MLTAEIVQILFTVSGTLLTIVWVARCLRNLHEMYSKGRNGVMVLQAWEKIVVGMLLLCLQLLWVITAIATFGPDATTAEGARFEHNMAVRGAVGSSIVLCIIAIKRWVWIRILNKDIQYQGKNR